MIQSSPNGLDYPLRAGRNLHSCRVRRQIPSELGPQSGRNTPETLLILEGVVAGGSVCRSPQHPSPSSSIIVPVEPSIDPKASSTTLALQSDTKRDRADEPHKC